MAGRRIRRIGAIFVMVVGLTVIATLATGEVALVTTHGISMEPRFHTGDLAVIVPAAQYHVGDVVGYHSPLLHIVVLHRIVAEHAGLFTFKGDNNSFLDPVRLTGSAIEGRLWLHIPQGGTVLGWFRSPAVLGLLAFLVVALGLGGASRRRRNRRPGARPGTSESGSEHTASATTAGTGWGPIAVALTLVGAFGLMTLATWTRPTTRPSERALPYDQHVSFSYKGSAPAGIIYPTGSVTTGDPVFLHLVDALEVGVHYTLRPTSSTAGAGTAAAAVSGTIGATATMQGPGGWTGQLAAVAPAHFSGTTAGLDLPIDLSRIPALEEEFTAETGVPLEDPQILVTPVVHVDGTMGGSSLVDSFAPALTFQVEGRVLDVVSSSAGGAGSGSTRLVADRVGSVDHRTRVPAHMSILGHSVAVSAVRRVALGGLVLSILGAVGAWAWWRRRRRMDETTRIHADYGRDLVAVSTSPAVKAPLVVDVETFDELARLARRYECVILEHAHVGGHAYYVESGTTLYRSGVECADPVLVPVDDPDRCAPVAAATPVEVIAARADDPPVRSTRRRLRSMPSPADEDTARIADEVDVLTCLAKAEWVSGVGDAGAHLREAVTLARKAELDEAMIEALLVNVRTSFDMEQESDPEKIELLEYALTLPGATPPRRARLLGALAVESIFGGEPARRGPMLDEALELARRSGDPRALIEVSASRFLSMPRSTWSAAQFTLDRPLFDDALGAAETLGDPIWVATTRSHVALGALIAGDGEQLRRHTTALAETSAGGQNQIALRSHLVLGRSLATLEGRLADAEALSKEASDVWRVTGLAETDARRAIGQIALRREQSRLADLIPALTSDETSRPPAAVAVAATAFALVESGHRDDAAILLHRADHAGFHDIPDDVDWPVALALWSEVATQIGDRHAAAELYEVLRPHDGTQMCAGEVACGPAARLLAVLENLLGHPADADRHFDEAIAFSRGLMSPVWVARCQLEWAQTWVERGETAWATQLADDADATAGMLALPALRLQWASLQDQLDLM